MRQTNVTAPSPRPRGTPPGRPARPREKDHVRCRAAMAAMTLLGIVSDSHRDFAPTLPTGHPAGQDLGRAPLRHRRALPTGPTRAHGPRALPRENFAAWGGAWWPLLARGARTPKGPKQPQFYPTLSNYFSKNLAYTPLFLSFCPLIHLSKTLTLALQAP